MKRNVWKTLFFTLLSLNILFVGYFTFKLLQPSNGTYHEDQIVNRNSSVEFIAFTDKKDLNQLINQYLEQNMYKDKIGYEVELTDHVIVKGQIPIFSAQVQYEMVLEPNVVKNGDLMLQLKSIQLGQLNIPASLVLTSVKDFYTLPSWIEILPEEKNIFVGITEIKMKSNLNLEVRTFDLKENDISFRVIMEEKRGKS